MVASAPAGAPPRARTRRANEREMLWIENERLRSLQSQIEVDVA